MKAYDVKMDDKPLLMSPGTTLASQGYLFKWMDRLILGWRPANERRRYFVTTSLIGWVQT